MPRFPSKPGIYLRAWPRACMRTFVPCCRLVSLVSRRMRVGKRGEIERPMRNVQRVHAPVGFGVYVHRREQFSEVGHYKCTPSEPSRSAEIDLLGSVPRARGSSVRDRMRFLSLSLSLPLAFSRAQLCARALSIDTGGNARQVTERRGILQALNSTRRRGAKIDLFSSFAGWLTNAAEGRGGRAGLVNGQKPIRRRCGSNVECVSRLLSRVSVGARVPIGNVPPRPACPPSAFRSRTRRHCHEITMVTFPQSA
jgi:hypothetical protein